MTHNVAYHHIFVPYEKHIYIIGMLFHRNSTIRLFGDHEMDTPKACPMFHCGYKMKTVHWAGNEAQLCGD